MPASQYPPARRSIGWLIKLSILLALIALVAVGIWLRWLPGRAVGAEWARGHASPDNALSYDGEDELSATLATPAGIQNASDFLFTMGEGGGRHGYDVIQVQADGHCTYRYPDLDAMAGNAATRQLDLFEASVSPGLAATKPLATTRPELAPNPWRECRFEVGTDTVRDLRQLLLRVNYCTLKRGYRATERHPTQWFIRVRADGREKAVWCDNHFPGAVIEINDFVRTQIVVPNEDKLAQTAQVQLPRNWLPDFALAVSAIDPDKPDPEKVDPEKGEPDKGDADR